MGPLVLSLCDYSGIAVEPWARAGYECHIIDIQHPFGVGEMVNNVRKVGLNILRYCPPLDQRIVFVFAFPPCTHMATSGAKWFKSKGLDALADSLHIVAACNRICEASGAPYLIEHPISTLATYWREPNYRFDPHEFAGYLTEPKEEAYTKRTCLWTGGGFKMPEKKSVYPTLGSKMHNISQSEDRANIRSKTPMGFSKAIFAANGTDL